MPRLEHHYDRRNDEEGRYCETIAYYCVEHDLEIDSETWDRWTHEGFVTPHEKQLILVMIQMYKNERGTS